MGRRGDHVVLSDSDGRIVIEKKAGEQDAQTAVVTGNRFGRVEQEAIVRVPQALLQMEHRIHVSDNVFAAAP